MVGTRLRSAFSAPTQRAAARRGYRRQSLPWWRPSRPSPVGRDEYIEGVEGAQYWRSFQIPAPTRGTYDRGQENLFPGVGPFSPLPGTSPSPASSTGAPSSPSGRTGSGTDRA